MIFPAKGDVLLLRVLLRFSCYALHRAAEARLSDLRRVREFSAGGNAGQSDLRSPTRRDGIREPTRGPDYGPAARILSNIVRAGAKSGLIRTAASKCAIASTRSRRRDLI
jgi:hypothetical protein